MAIYEFTRDKILPLDATTFSRAELPERQDMQRLLRENISVIVPDALVISEEFGEREESCRRIDLLGIDREANLVVIALERAEDGGHMELQAIRHAAMVSAMTFDQAVDAFGQYLAPAGKEDGVDPEAELLNFLGWSAPDEGAFAQDVKIVLASSEFSRALTTSAMWLIERGLDIRCVRLQPYGLDDRLFVDVQQIIPSPEAAEYQAQIRKKVRKAREVRSHGPRYARDYTRYNLTLGDEKYLGEPKRRAIHLALRYLVESGVEPEEIAERCALRINRVFMSVDGEVGQDAFLQLARKAKAAENRKFDPGRFFCRENELVQLNGRTHAFSNQWTAPEWLATMTAIRGAFPKHGIDFSEVG